MNSRERLLAAMKCQPVDRVPIGPFGMGKLNIDDPFTWDFIQRTDPFVEVGAGGDAISGSSWPVTREDNPGQIVMTLTTRVGPLTKVITHNKITSATTDYFCKSTADVEAVLALPYEPPQVAIEHYHAMCDRVGDEGLVLVGLGDGICFPADYLSPEAFCILWLDAPELLTEMVRVGSERMCAFVEGLCQEGVRGFRIVGGEYASVQLGPQGFSELVVPFDRELVEIIHRYDGIAYFHNHGPVKAYYDLFTQIGFDALDPLEASPWGDALLAEAKVNMPDVCLVGNLDDMEQLEQIPLEEICEIGRLRIAEAGQTGFVLGGTASGTYTEKGALGFMALVDVAEEMAT